MIDRLPPQSLEAEQSVLGAILIDRDAVIEVAEFLRPAGLLPPGERRASTRPSSSCSSGASRSTSSRSPRRSSATRSSRRSAAGPTCRACRTRRRPPSTPSSTPGSSSARRSCATSSAPPGRIAGIGYEDPAEIQEAIDRAEAELFAVSQKRVDAGFSPLKSLLHDAYDRLDYLHAHRGEISGVRTGFTDLDTLTTGLQKSDLIVARRPADRSARRASRSTSPSTPRSRRRKSVGVFSLEMSKEQLVLRLLSSVANIDSQRLRTGFLEEMDFARIAPAMNALSEAPMYIDDTPNITAMELRTKARRLQAEAGLDLVIVDYLQLMQATTNEPRRQPRPGGVGDLARAQGARPRAVGPGHRAVASCRASRRCASRRSRACRTCASRARSSRTRTS